VPFWQNIGDALRVIWETLTSEEADAELEETPEPEPEIGGVGGDDEEPPAPPYWGDEGYELPDEPFAYQGGGPYPETWEEAGQVFWDTNAQTIGGFEDSYNYEEIQQAFYDGFMATDAEVTSAERIAAREEFYDLSDLYTIDWDSFRDYWGYEEA